MANTEFNPSKVQVNVTTAYLPGHSAPDENQYTFAYTITINNAGNKPVQLLSRHWVITDADSSVQEVRGDGVVGEQPVIPPGESYRYTSGATLNTPVGFMEGSYYMVVHDSEAPAESLNRFQVPIPAFTLHTPTALN
ncbi:Co2+/Mg2+ efflux protein ApaG [Haliea sp. E17]|uniref:Co2+/Mg2+ efflux protein ApaG n=1 Tax=Haliea sp. E17 TaxID=3401576 RepID=UPI003AAB31B3